MMTLNVKSLSTNKVEKIEKISISNETLATLIKLTSNRDISSYEDWAALLESEFNAIVPIDQLVNFFSLEREIEDLEINIGFGCQVGKLSELKEIYKAFE